MRCHLLVGAMISVMAAGPGSADGWISRTMILQSEDGIIVCALGLAHWYEVMTDPARPEMSAQIPLFLRSTTGEIGLKNNVGDKMRLESIICGNPAESRIGWQRMSIEPLRRADAAKIILCDGNIPECRWN